MSVWRMLVLRLSCSGTWPTAKGGATVFDVALLREAVGLTMGVKASGDAEQTIAAGATRIGASAGVEISSKRWPR